MSYIQENGEITKSESKVSADHSIKCNRRCVQKGDRICYNDEGYKEMIQKIPDDSAPTDSTESIDLDSIHSGESLFKTFSFDAQDNDPDLEKCMAFWKSILAKNVKPIKCTVLKPKKESKEKVIKEPKVEDPCQDDQTRKMWLNIYKHLQRKKLDKMKLGKKQTCDPCSDYVDEDYEKKRDSEEIKKLNDWTSQNTPTRSEKLDIKSQVKNTLQTLQAARSSKGSLNDTTKNTIKGRSKDANVTQEAKGEKNVQPPRLQKQSSVKIIPNSNYATKDKKSVEEIKTSHLQTHSVSNSALKTLQAPRLQKQSSVRIVGSSSFVTNDKKSVDENKTELHETQSNTSKPVSSVLQTNSNICNSVLRNLRTKLAASKEIPSCCNCGCSVEECICAEMEECLGTEILNEQKVIQKRMEDFIQSCHPCNCGTTCTCDHGQDKEVICSCGCKVENCICENSEPCSCSCGVEECICQNLDEGKKKACSCGCGFDECICEQLFTKSCKCGYSDCTCDIIEILTTYLETLDTTASVPISATSDYLKFASTEAQTDEDKKWLHEATQQQGSYCIICGHFNCCCNLENKETA